MRVGQCLDTGAHCDLQMLAISFPVVDNLVFRETEKLFQIKNKTEIL